MSREEVETTDIVRVVHRGEEPPRCFKCGHRDWDLIWEDGHDVHPRALRGGCQDPPEGWTACYRCGRMIAPEEQRPVVMRYDYRTGDTREERFTVKEVEVGVEPHRSGGHTHQWPGAETRRQLGSKGSLWFTARNPKWVNRRQIPAGTAYEGDPVEGCPGCWRTIYEKVRQGEWDEQEVELVDGTRVPYTERFPAVEAIRCDGALARDCQLPRSRRAIDDDALAVESGEVAEATGIARFVPDEWTATAEIAKARKVTARAVTKALAPHVERGEIQMEKRPGAKGGRPLNYYRKARS